MHSVVMESLEDYLAGELQPAALREFESHLDVCSKCREEVRSMAGVGGLFAILKGDGAPEPSPRFCANVMQWVEERQRTPSFSGLLALDFAFGRRLAFAALLTLAVLGSYLVSRETDYTVGPSPEAVMAQDNNSGADRGQMLVTLTTYEP
jgi:anti-sigma factor RsiW